MEGAPASRAARVASTFSAIWSKGRSITLHLAGPQTCNIRYVEVIGIIDFFARHDLTGTPVVERNTPRGILRIASPEATALELIGYPDHGGGLSNVATVLLELVEAMEVGALEAEARRAPLAWVQRLGYLLTLIEADEYAAALGAVLGDRTPFFVALAPSVSMIGAPRNARWSVAVNADVEPDL